MSLRLKFFRTALLAVLCLFFATAALAQTQSAPPAPAPTQLPAASPASTPDSSPSASSEINIPISIGDDVEVSVYDVPEMSTHEQVDGTGDLHLPLINKVHIAGLTSDTAAAVIEKRLRDGGFILDPHVTVYVKQYSAGAISILGAIAHPGVYPASSERRLWDIILAAGGLTPEAGDRVLIQHAHSNEVTAATLSRDPESALKENIDLEPGDTIVVERAAVFYVIGEVQHAAAYSLQGDMGVVQALARADGPTHDAALNRITILRKNGADVQKIPVDLKKVLEAKASDPTLQQGDIIFVPGRHGQYAALSATQTAFGIAAALAMHAF